jgi:hypothetical protein
VDKRRLRARRGFTIGEMLLSMSLMLGLIGLSTQLFRRQSNSVSTQAGRLDAQQNSRFALSFLDRELRVAGVGVVDQQPLLVMAGATAITFNANLVALDTGDLGAVYINPDADSGAVNVLRSTTQITLPGTSVQYPDSTYMQAVGVPSNAETISFWLAPDSSSQNNEYILWRRANNRPPRAVARGILYNPGDTIFQYFKSDTTGGSTPVPMSALPLVHSAVIHGSQADTGKSALTDSIRLVRVSFTSLFRDPRTNQNVQRRMQSTIRIMNAGLIRHTTCGNPPLGVVASAAVTVANPPTVPQTLVTISWNRSVDEGTGEKDVERYAIYRRLSTDPAFDQPFASVPAGLTSYTFEDTDVRSGQSWIYGVASQDCTPMSSPISATTTVIIP